MGKILSAYLCPHPPVLIPEIGRGEEKKVQETINSFRKISKEIRELSPTTIVVITPHGPLFRDAIAIGYEKELKGNLKNFGCPDVSISKSNNIPLVDKIVEKALQEGSYCVKLNRKNATNYGVSTDLDHGVQVPLYFIEKEYTDYKLVHLTYGLLSPEDLYKFGTLLQECLEESNEKAVIIASGDLSHKLTNDGPYNYNSAGPQFDSLLMKLLKEEKYQEIIAIDKSLSEEAGECGLRSIQIMLGALDGFRTKSDILSYEGPLGVGYAVAKFNPSEKSEEYKILNKLYEKAEKRILDIKDKEDEFVKLARFSLESYIKNGSKIEVSGDLPKALLSNRAGVFVSIKKDGELRGCIGTIGPTTKNIAEGIIRNAINAGTDDPRFFPIEEDELDKLIYSVDVLGESEKISSMDELDENRYGVIVSSKGKRGLLLPNLDGIASVEEQVNIALQKAGISKHEDFELERFEVIRHK